MLCMKKCFKYRFDIYNESDDSLSECLGNICIYVYKVKLETKCNEVNVRAEISVEIEEDQLEDFIAFAEIYLNVDFRSLEEEMREII